MAMGKKKAVSMLKKGGMAKKKAMQKKIRLKKSLNGAATRYNIGHAN